jgi:hypothetical protein
MLNTPDYGPGSKPLFQWRCSMKNPLFPACLMIVAALAAIPAAAQLRGSAGASRGGVIAAPTPVPHIINPSTSLSAPATSPLQQQEQDDYATQLRSAQHDLLLQNPSGSTRPEMGLSRALNGFTPQ